MIYKQVAEFCHFNLLKNEEALNYLDNRKISLDSIKKFQIGLFPQDFNNLFNLIDIKKLKMFGIIKTASSSPFRIQNLTFPIKDVYGNYIALAGRTMIDEGKRIEYSIAKYKNSIYKKSHHLFGLNTAKHSILQNNKVYVVEGYFDVIAPHQHGISNVVATCGTFLSVRHVALLARYTNNVVVVMDNEIVAQQKAKKIVARKYDGINVSLLNPLEDQTEKDLDEFLRNHEAKELIIRLQ